MSKLDIKASKNAFNENILQVLYDYNNFTEIYYGGASSGKSHGVVQKVVIKALSDWQYPRKVLWLRKVGTSVKDSIFADVKACLSSFNDESTGISILDLCRINKTNFEIELPNGAVFIFKGMDDPEKIKSIKGISDIVMEEASEFNLDDYTQLVLRLRERKHLNKQMFLMFNPVSKANWVYKTFFLRKLEGVSINHSTYKDNRFLDEHTVKNIEKLADRNPSYYKIYALGEFATLDKLVFPKYEVELIDVEALSDLPSYFGLDFGFVNDPSAFIHLKVDEKNKKLYFIEEYVRKGMTNDIIAEVIKSLGYSKEVIYADSAEQKSISEIRQHGIERILPVKKRPGSVLQGIQLLQQFDLVVDERCVKLIEELENYTWQKDRSTGEYINKPCDSYNHVIDASRYALQNFVFNADDGDDEFYDVFLAAWTDQPLTPPEFRNLPKNLR